MMKLKITHVKDPWGPMQAIDYVGILLEFIMPGMQQNEKSPAFGVKRKLGMSNFAISYSFQSICLL